MAVRSRFFPEGSDLGDSAPIVLYLEDSTSETEEHQNRVALFFSNPIEALNTEFADQGVRFDDTWKVQTHVVDHHKFPFGWIWTMTAVVVPDNQEIIVTAIKHGAPEEDDSEDDEAETA